MSLPRSISLPASVLRFALRHGVKGRTEPGAPIEELRGVVDDIARMFPRPPASARLEDFTLGGRPALRVRAADADPGKTILYLHGGGYVSGTLAMYQDLAFRIAEASRATVVLLDYRLAPEHPFPGAIDDATAAYVELLERGHAPSSVAVAGDSAGGGLTFSTLVNLRDGAIPLPSACWVLSPWTDLAYRGASIRVNRDRDPMIRVELIKPTVDLYLAGRHPETPLASPLHADLRGLPPTLLHVGSTEVLLDDSVRMAERLEAAGVRAALRVYDDLPHVFHLFAPYLRDGREAIREGARFLVAHLR